MPKEVPPKLCNVFGFQQIVKGGLGFSEHDTIFYLAGRQGVHHKLKQKGQHFTSIPESYEVTAVGFGLNNLLLIAVKGQKPLVSIFNLKTNEKKTLTCANKVMSHSYVWVSFSEDGVRVGGQGGPPDWAFVLWNLKKNRLETVFHPFRLEPGAQIYKFAFCPSDSKRVVAVGDSFLRAYRCKDDQKIQEQAVRQLERSGKTFHCVAWIQKSALVAVGTSDGAIFVFENMQLVRKVDVTQELERIQKGINVDDQNVTCIATTGAGFLCSHGSTSILYFKEDFKLHKVLNITKYLKETRVLQLCINPQEDTVAVATNDGRIMACKFGDNSWVKGCEDTFQLIQDFQHIEKVLCADTLPSVSLQASCSKSRIILRDFSTERTFLREELSAVPCSLSVCPLPICLAIGYEGSAKIYNIVLDALVETKCFQVSTHSQVSYAPGGHLLAFTDNNIIRLCYSIGFKELKSLEGKAGKVHIVRWRNNMNLLSVDDTGTICEWDIAREDANKGGGDAQKSDKQGPPKVVLWKLSIPGAPQMCMAIPRKDRDVYVADTEGTIRLVQEGRVLEKYSPNVAGISGMVVVEKCLLVGSVDGKVLGLNLSLSATKFQVQCQTGSIIHFASLPDNKSIMALDEFGIRCTWNFDSQKSSECLPIRTTVLIDLEKQKKSLRFMEDLEEGLQRSTEKTDAGRKRHEKELKETEAEASEKYKRIQDSLRATAQELKEELNEIKASLEEDYLKEKQIIEKAKEENEKDFLQKLSEEEAHLKRQQRERERIISEFEKNISQRIKEKEMVIEDFQSKFSNHEGRIQELKDTLEKEKVISSEMKRERLLREKEKTDDVPVLEEDLISGQDAYTDIKIHEERDRHISEMEELESQFIYQKECCRSVEEVFKTKHRHFRLLQDVEEALKKKVIQVHKDIERTENVLTTKSELSRELEKAAAEASTEGNQKIEECQEEIRMKNDQLQELKNQLQKCKESHEKLCTDLKGKKREETDLNERLKSTENSVMNNKRELLAAERLLERYRMEFINSTSECPNARALRWAMLRLYEKRVAKTVLKEESLSFTDTDPYVRFCKQRDHCEELIKVVRNRTSQIEATFRENFIKLAKENSDWRAFAEAIRADIRRKQDRIRCLEEGLGLTVGEFGQNPAETRRRLLETAETLIRLQKEEDEQIEQRHDLIKEQQKDILRLHGLLSVEEKGKIIRKMR